MTSIKLACINIERSKHLDRVLAFLREYQPDVLCLQEVSEPDLPLFRKLMGQNPAFAPMTRHTATQTVVGPAMIARVPLEQVSITYYKGDPAQIPQYISSGAFGTDTERPDTKTINHPLIAATVQGFRIATTHLTWTYAGESTPEQLADADRMLHFADQEAQAYGGLVLCGDFNAPRGKETFAKIATRFTDAIPAHYKTSLDLDLHRVGRLNPAEAERMKMLMVDGLFHTPGYKLSDVKLTPGVSDHQAITATLSRA